jgi:hypothetical protein
MYDDDSQAPVDELKDEDANVYEEEGDGTDILEDEPTDPNEELDSDDTEDYMSSIMNERYSTGEYSL